LEHQYVSYLSDYLEWKQLKHAENWILYPENVGEHLSIDETSLSQGELYTVLTNKAGTGKKGTLVAMIKGCDSKEVSKILKKISKYKRYKVKEVTLDMAASMQKIVTDCFPRAMQVTDRFHVQKLAFDALQEIRIAHRWNAIDQENKEYKLAKELGKKFKPEILENGDTHKQLLARSRYLLFKTQSKWTPSQGFRAEILFKYYPDIEKAYKLSQELGSIYRFSKSKGIAYTKLARWYNKVEKAEFKQFGTISRTIQNHYQSILNYFDNKSTNASAESFNAKIKAFRYQFRGVRRIPFFLFRLANIFA